MGGDDEEDEIETVRGAPDRDKAPPDAKKKKREEDDEDDEG